MRQSWTDDRLDDLSRRMDERFDRVDERFDRVDERFDRVEGAIKAEGEIRRQEIAGLEARLEARITETHVRLREDIAEVHNDNRQIHADLQASNAQLHAFQRTMVQVVGALGGTAIATLAGLLIAHL